MVQGAARSTHPGIASPTVGSRARSLDDVGELSEARRHSGGNGQITCYEHARGAGDPYALAGLGDIYHEQGQPPTVNGSASAMLGEFRSMLGV